MATGYRLKHVGSTETHHEYQGLGTMNGNRIHVALDRRAYTAAPETILVSIYVNGARNVGAKLKGRTPRREKKP